MGHFLGVSGSRLGLIFFGILLLGIASLRFIVPSKPVAPFVPVVSVCKTLKPGIRRIGNEYGIQFDVATSDLSIHEGVEDAPPFTHGFGLTPKNSTSVLEISYGDNQSLESFGTDPVLTFSEHFEKRSISDEKGQLLGEDYWGYLDRSKRWRRVHLKGWVDARYGFVSEKEAKLFDTAINSVCLSPVGP